MKISLFKKYLSITMGIILIAFIILGTFLMVFVNQFWDTRNLKKAKEDLNSYVLLTTKALENNNDQLEVKDQETFNLMIDLSKNNSYNLIITDAAGTVYKITRPDKNIKKGYQMPFYVTNALIKDQYYESETKTDFFYSDTKLTVASPFKLKLAEDKNKDIAIAGYIFVCVPEHTIENGLPNQIFQILIYAVLASVLVSCLLAGVFSYTQSKQLKQMSEQAKKFAKGDFSGRIPVKGKDEVGQLTRAFNDMADALDKEESVRRDFIANISHELKTPMTTIAGFIDGILDGTIPESKQKHYLTIVSEEISRLSGLVASMLSLARIDSGKTTIYKTKFSLISTIVNILLTFEDRLEEKKIEIVGLETADGLSVYGDQALLHQVLYNLIENATKFTPQGGEITFHAESKGDKLYFSVKNSGKGISQKDLPFIFDKFYKTDKSRSEDKKSMGLGLYLVKTIINLHGGEITVTSEIDKETCFAFWIPNK